MTTTDRTFVFEKAGDSTGFLLWRLTNLWQREIKKALKPFGITHSQFVLLASIHWLTIHKRGVTQILLSRHTGIDAMTTSTVLRTLQSAGFVERQEHASDTRAKTVALTAKGVETTKRAIKIVEEFDKDFFSKLKSGAPAFNKGILTLLGE